MGGASPRRRSLRGELGRAGRGVPSSCRCRERAGEAVGEEGAPGFTCRLQGGGPGAPRPSARVPERLRERQRAEVLGTRRGISHLKIGSSSEREREARGSS